MIYESFLALGYLIELLLYDKLEHRRGHGVHWLHLHPHRAKEKILGPNLPEKVVSAPPDRQCTPEAEQESIFEEIEVWPVREVIWAVLACVSFCVLKATTKKSSTLVSVEYSRAQ